MIRNFLDIIRCSLKVEFTSKSLNYASIILPIIATLPGLFLTKKVSISTLMQIIDAFSTLTTALFFIMDKYPLFAKWEAVIDRLTKFENQLNHHMAAKSSIEFQVHQEKSLKLNQLTLLTPDGKSIFKDTSFTFLPETRYAIMGQSGQGKTVFLKALAGLWPYGAGFIQHNKKAKITFIPQKPFLSGETLRTTLLGINSSKEKKENLKNYLLEFGFIDLINKLDIKADWNKILSLGEQQRLMLIKAIIEKPTILMLDEATSSMDEKCEAKTYEILEKYLPKITLIHITHHEFAKAHHDICLLLDQQTLNEIA